MKYIVALIVSVSLIPSAFAAKNAYTECGIGAMIFPTTPIGAVISNIIWDLGTTATSSSSSSEGQCAGKSATAAKFIHETYTNLEEETAAGQGEHLEAMLDILDCEKSAYPAIISDVRADFAKDVTSPSYVSQSALKKSEAYFTNVMDKVSKKYASQCSAT